MKGKKVLIEVGAGETAHRPSYLHVDVRPVPGVDLIAHARRLPFASEVADEIYAAHMIEHLSYEDGSKFLTEIFSALKKGGRVELSCPDLERVSDIYGKIGNLNHRVGIVDAVKSILYGSQSHQFDFHRSGYDFRLLSRELREAGFARIRKLAPGGGIPATQRPSVRALYELHVEAWKGEPNDMARTSTGPLERHKSDDYLITEIALRDAEISRLAERFEILKNTDEKTLIELQGQLQEQNKRMTQLQQQLIEKDSLLRSITSERELAANLEKKLAQKLEQAKNERAELVHQLNRNRSELEQIRSSFGYAFMKFYSSRIDRLFPNGTSRGEFRKVVTASVQVIMHEGLRSFLRKFLEKTKLRKFEIVDTTQKRILQNPLATERLPIIPHPDEVLSQGLRKFILAPEATIEFSLHENPRVSIIIVTYNKAHYAYQCIRSIVVDKLLPPYEIILVDNASTDETRTLLRRVKNAKVILNSENRFFPRANNQGARLAKGEYVLFLNQDAFIHPGCASWLMKTLDLSPNIGAAGAKLIAPDGRLLEAGSVIWNDGSCLGYGRGDDPTKPEYCFLREVDYCSAACLMVRRDLFESLGGFDEQFVPAYYEDTDLCMRIWEKGYRILYQPFAAATHIEFSSSSFERATKLMAGQQKAFVSKHEESLKSRLEYSEKNVLRARDRRASPSILVMDDCVPKPEDGSGYPRMFQMLKSMASLGFRVTLLPLLDATPKQPNTDMLTQMGVEVLWGIRGVRETLESRRDCYDIILISRPHNALPTMKLARETNPNARLIYDAEALWYKREQLRRNLGLSPADPRFESEDVELSLIGSADYVICVSEAEKKIIEQKLGGFAGKILLWGHPHSLAPTTTPFGERRDLLFVGGFKSSPAHNDDAVIHFAGKLLPRIRKRIEGVKFVVAGSNPPSSVKRIASDFVIVTGYVEDLAALYRKARVFVAPVRFGAGAMWKATEAMSHGIPCVLSKVAAEGLGIRDGEEALVAYDDEDFVNKTVRLYENEALWTHVRGRALDYIARKSDPAELETRLGEFLWMMQTELSRYKTHTNGREVAPLTYQPTISVITPVYDTDPRWLTNSVDSVVNQTYPEWQLCIADDASNSAKVRSILQEYSARNRRIKVMFLDRHLGKAGASNEALSLATGEFVALLGPDDELRRDALYEVVRFLNQNPDFDLVYTDQDHVNERGITSDPFFKPDWSPDLLMSYNYVSDFSVYRRSIMEQIGGFRQGFDGSQDYDLVLRFSEMTKKIGHVPKVLCSKRKAKNLPTGSLDSRLHANEAAVRALEEAAIRRGFDAEVTEIRAGGPYRVRYGLRGTPLVSIIIPTRNAGLTESCLQSLMRSTYHNLEVLVLDSSNGSKVKQVARKFRSCRVLQFENPMPFNFSKMNNWAAGVARGEYLIFLNDDTEVMEAGWIEAMLEHAQRPGVGAVGARLLYPNGSVQHAGVILGLRGPAEHYAGIHGDDLGYYDLAGVVRNCSAVTAACMMVKRQLFMDEGMFDEALGRSWQDVDFCLRLMGAGYRIVYTPFASLIHRHGATRGVVADTSPDEDAARELFHSRWHSLIELGDKYYNPNLSKERPYEVESQDIILNLGD